MYIIGNFNVQTHHWLRFALCKRTISNYLFRSAFNFPLNKKAISSVSIDHTANKIIVNTKSFYHIY